MWTWRRRWELVAFRWYYAMAQGKVLEIPVRAGVTLFAWNNQAIFRFSVKDCVRCEQRAGRNLGKKLVPKQGNRERGHFPGHTISYAETYRKLCETKSPGVKYKTNTSRWASKRGIENGYRLSISRLTNVRHLKLCHWWYLYGVNNLRGVSGRHRVGLILWVIN